MLGKKEAAHPGRVCGFNAVRSLFYFLGEFGALFEFNGFAGSDFDSFFGAGIDAGAGSFFSNRECSETNESNFFAGGKSSRDGFNSGFESGFGISFGQAGFFGDCKPRNLTFLNTYFLAQRYIVSRKGAKNAK